MKNFSKPTILLLAWSFYSSSAFAVESLSYSGRLVNPDGSPVTGTRTLRFDLAYSSDATDIQCTKQVSAILTNGVFHARIDIAPGDCAGISTNPSLTTFLADTTSGDQLIRVSDVTGAPKVYSFQPLYPIPSAIMASMAKTLSPLTAGDTGKVLQWNGSAWIPALVSGGGGGTYGAGSIINAAAGSAAAPSLSFNSETDTGFYSSGANTIGVAAGGSQIFNISANGLVSTTAGGADITTAAGSNSAPTYSFSGDSDTGWFAPLANTLAAVTGGVERLRIDSNGKIGIGTSTPYWPLTITSNQPGITINGIGNIGTTGANLRLYSSRGSALTPSNVLAEDDLGAVAFSGYWDGKASNEFINGESRAAIVARASENWVGSSNNGTSIAINTTPNGSNTPTERLRIDHNGNVGIGITPPTASLHLKAGVDASGGAPFKLSQGVNLSTPEAGAVEFDGTNLYFTTNTPTRKTIATTDGGTFTNTSGISNAGGNITISPNNLSGSVTVGPGTISTSPSTGTLVVSGDQGVTGSVNVGTKIMNASGTAGSPSYTFGSDTDTGWFAPLADTLAAATGGAERIRIDSTGNVGIGTTTPSSTLAVNGSISVQRTNTQEYRFNGGSSNQWRVISTINGATNGRLDFTNTTDNFSSNFTTPLTLMNSGNIGVGTTTPTAALHVNSNSVSNSILGFTIVDNEQPASLTTLPEIFGGSITNNFLPGMRDFALINRNFASQAGTQGFTFVQQTGTGTFKNLMYMDGDSGNIGIGTQTPSATLDIKAGTSTAGTAPLKLTSGVNLTTPEAGAIEYDGTNLYFTDSSNTRRTLSASGSTAVQPIAGSAAAPSHSFSTDTDTGFFSSGANQIGISAGGAQIFNMSSSGIVSSTAGGGSISTAAGSAAAPTFSFAGDTDTGWYSPAADTLAASTAGAERIRINNLGNAEFKSAPLPSTVDRANNFRVTQLTGGNATFLDINNRRHTAGADWNGTNSRIQRTVDVTKHGFIDFGIDGLAANAGLGFGSNESTHMAIISTGQVGIGTTNPLERLDVAGRIRTSDTVETTNGVTGNLEFTSNFNYRGNGYGYYLSMRSDTGHAHLSVAPSGLAGVAASLVKAMVWTSAGKVGIGTDNPATPLEVNGTITSTGLRAGQGIPNAADGSTNGIAFGADGDTGIFAPGSGGAAGILAFYSNNAELMRVGAGRVGIGTTSPSSKLHISETSAATSGVLYGSMGIYSLNPAADTTASPAAAYFEAKHDSTFNKTSGGLYGVQGYASNNTTATVASVMGGFGEGRNTSTGTSTTTTGWIGQSTNSSTGSIGVASGLKGTISNAAGGSIGTAYELYLNTANAGTITSQFGVYQTTAASKNYFAGNVGIGTNSPTLPLEVSSSSTNATLAKYSCPSGYCQQVIQTVTGVIGDMGASSTDNLVFLGANSNHPLAIRTNALERIRITNAGNVGIGTSTVNYKLDVDGDINIAAASALKFNGNNVCTSAGCTTSSDRNLKENIHPLTGSLEKILQLQGVEYDYKDKKRFTAKHQVGVIAQDVEKIFPEVVVVDKDSGLRSVAYDNLVAPLIESVKTIYASIVKQDRSIASLEKKMSEKDQQIEKLKSQNALMQERLDRIEKAMKR